MFTHVLVPFQLTADMAMPLALACRIAVATNTGMTLICPVPGTTTLHDPRCVATETAARHLLSTLPSERPNALEIIILPLAHDANLASYIATQVATHPGSLIVLAGREAGDKIVEAILAASPDPVLLVRPDIVSVPDAGLAGGIVVPLDGTTAGAAAIEPAVQLAAVFGVELFLLRVVEPTEEVSGPTSRRGIALEPELQADHFAFADARYYIDEQVRQLRSRGLVVHGRATFGATSATILETACRLDAGMIAMSTHLITPDEPRFAEHSVAATVARQANCPVVLLRRAESTAALTREATVAARV